MKKILFLTLALVFTFAVAKDIHFKGPDGKFEFWAKDGGVDMKPDGSGTFNLKGPATLKMGTESAFDMVIGGTASGKLSKGVTKKSPPIVDSFTANGGVQVSAKLTTRNTDLAGSSATYDGTAKGGTLNLSGPVTIHEKNLAKRTNLNISGLNAVATVNPYVPKGESPIKEATLEGDVTIDVKALLEPDDTEPKTLHATGSKAVYSRKTLPATITLTGDVVVTGQGELEATGIKKVVITLNEQGEMINSNFSSEGDGLTTTKVNNLSKKLAKKKKGGSPI